MNMLVNLDTSALDSEDFTRDFVLQVQRASFLFQLTHTLSLCSILFCSHTLSLSLFFLSFSLLL